MLRKLGVPANVTAAVKNDSVTISWRAVAGADGYKLFFYEANEPSVCIKTRYSEKSEKTVSGFELEKEYFVKISAFSFENNAEHMGEASPLISFKPVLCALKAEGALYLEVGQTTRIRYEYTGATSALSFVSVNPKVAEVSSDGTVRALKRGSCVIRITSNDNQTSFTKIIVGRSQKAADKHIVMMLTGEIMCSAGLCGAGQDFFSAFDRVKHILNQADYSAGVFDMGCCDKTPFEYEQRHLPEVRVKPNAPKAFVSAIANAGFDAVFTAGENSLANGVDGLKQTVETIKGAGLHNIGTFGDNPFVANIKGFKVGFAAVNLVPQDNPDEPAVINYGAKYDREYFVELVNTARSMGAEYIVVCAHWGMVDSHQIRKSQLEEAKFMANSGADLIVGTHTRTVQYFSVLSTKDGRKVPCAYSLGNFLSSSSDMEAHRDGVILRVELFRKRGKVTAECTAIPCYSADADFGVYASAAYPIRNSETELSVQRTTKYLGNRIKPYKPMAAIIGSSILSRILTAGEGFRIDTTAMYLSPLSLGAREFPTVPDGVDGTLQLDLGKDLRNSLSKCDIAVVDFYTAATVSCFKYGNELFEEPCYFSNSKKLRGSEFYAEHRSEWLRIRPPFGETMWKPLVRRFAERLLEVFPSEKIVLFRTKISSARKCGDLLRTVPENARQNRLIHDMENFFISLVNPAVIDLSKNFFVEEGTLVSFEEDYYFQAYSALCDILSGSGRSYVDNISPELWFARAMKFYNSMTQLSLQDRLLDMNDAADKLVAYTNAEFCARNSDRIIRLKRAGRSDLMYVKEFFAGEREADELVNAAEIIHLVEKGNLTYPYDVYADAFEKNYYIVKYMAKLLAKESGCLVNERNAEMVFLLRDKPQARRYFPDLYQNAVDIWGSRVSRICAERCSDAYINEVIIRQSQLLCKEKPSYKRDDFKPEDFNGDQRLFKVTRSALTADGIDRCENSPAPWIVIDFAGIINKMADYNGVLFELTDPLQDTDFYKKIKSECSEGYIFEKRNMKMCSESITFFANEMLELYGDNIILIKTQPSKTYVTKDNRLGKINDDLYEIKKKFISLCEERFAGITHCYVIDISKNFYSSERYPYGGKGLTNYEDEFYRQTSEYLSQIIRGSEQKIFTAVDENYILLRTLKTKRD